MRSEYLRSLSVRSCHSTASPLLITLFWKFCLSNSSVLLFSTFVVTIPTLGPFIFALINYARAVNV